MSSLREPVLTRCPYLDECIVQVDEQYFLAFCKGECEKCQYYSQMGNIPRAWERRLEQKEMDKAFSSTRSRGRQ